MPGLRQLVGGGDGEARSPKGRARARASIASLDDACLCITWENRTKRNAHSKIAQLACNETREAGGKIEGLSLFSSLFQALETKTEKLVALCRTLPEAFEVPFSPRTSLSSIFATRATIYLSHAQRHRLESNLLESNVHCSLRFLSGHNNIPELTILIQI